MSLSIDKDLGEQGENARAVLASWLDDYISGRCDRADMQAQFLSVCRSNPDAPWDALALLDQYQRRGRIDVALARSLKTDIAQLVFGVANQTETKDDAGRDNQDTTDVTIDTTGSRWRKLMAERDPASINSEPAFVDPSLLRRGDEEVTTFRRELEEPLTRPPPPLKHTDDDTVLARPRREEPTHGVHTHGPAIERERERERPMRSSSVPPPGLTSDVLRDRYELTSILGRGSTGTVYKAVDRHRAHLDPTARCVAVKVLKLNYQDRPDELAQLEREFHEAQSLSHPNVVSVFDLDRDGNVYFIVMELLEGELLADILKRLDGQPMARHYALGIISSVGAALAHAHRRGIVHADLKPRNIMITTTGEVRVLDFGFARDRPLELHTASGLNDGPNAAPAYASVERVNGSDPHPSDDVYSLACISYELLSGRHPFGGRSAPLARAHGRAPQRIPGLTGKQQQTLQRALLWTRGERRIDIVELLAGLGCGEAPSRLGSPSELAVPDSSLARWRRAALALTLAFIFAGGMYAVWQYGLLPKNLANVIPVMPPIADRELQSEQAGRSTDQVGAGDSVGSKPVAAVTPPKAEPPPSEQRQTAPSVPVPLPSTKQSPQVQDEPVEKDQPKQQTSRTQAAPGAAGSSAPVASSASSAGATRPVIVEFDKDSYVTSEGDGSVRLIIRRTGSTRRPVTVHWTLRSNSAEMGADFAGIGPGVEVIPAGAREASITVPLVQDSIKETTELFLVELQVNEEGVSLGERSSAAVIIVDDD
ncbi:protein kinase domain-containing protein [Peristeroidobacter soli]|jgi:serine/threonine protein kinase|uniref:protein kinase domain-containing protein n=1 Tax=Peristeroidobacter soli TaxID=2497877 RepID=UPI00101CC976|nr:protein kinase [Peristeroidobacter soli]